MANRSIGWISDVRLQRRASRVVNGFVYTKWIITIPPSDIEKLQWKEGDELESEVKDNVLVLKKSEKPPEAKEPKMSYEQFKRAIAGVLSATPDGLSWTDIRERLSLPQRVPNNLWVRMMERDINLLRIKDVKTGKTLWRVKTVVGSSNS